MKKAIVFGANGYIGRHLVYYLGLNQFDVMPSDISSSSVDNHKVYKSVDITLFNDVQSLDFEVDYIFCFGGLTGTNVGFDQYQKFIEVNELGLLNILTHHKNSESKARIVFPSTRLVYKGKKDDFLKEDSQKEALTIYAQNKLSCEAYLQQYATNFNINFTVFRICVPYGNVFDEKFSYGTVGFFLNKGKIGDNITLYGNGDLRRTFTHVEDICLSILKTLESSKSENETYNVGSNDNLSLLEVANLFAEKYSVKIEFNEWPEAALKVESGDTIFDDNKLLSTTNYQYKHSINEWVKKF